MELQVYSVCEQLYYFSAASIPSQQMQELAVDDALTAAIIGKCHL